MTRFSLIVPFHNSPRIDRRAYLGALLESLPDRDDLEVVLVDDHSEIPFAPAHPLRKTAVRVVPNRPDRRYAGTARNTGLEEATGDIVFFADSDDLFRTRELSAVLDRLAAETDWDLALARMTSFFDDGTPGNRHEFTEDLLCRFAISRESDDLIRYHIPAAKFIRHDFIKAHGLRFGDTRVANDVLFAVKLIAAGPRVRLCDEVVYMIRQGNPSLTADTSGAAVRTRIAVGRDVQKVLIAAGKPDKVVPMYFYFKRYWRDGRLLVLSEAARSVLRGDKVFPGARVLRRDIRAALRLGSRLRAIRAGLRR